ncbi:MAG TPA: T9SS type A sorting domain-containing protein [Saprospiraceae bacterium]|nr:T9SS type A sorting domain-containing protein [Saprospiraceae bacterium]
MKVLPLFIFSIFIQGFVIGQVNYGFSSHNSPFVMLAGDTTVSLTAAFPPSKTILNEGFANQVPIGFEINYNGQNYNVIHLNINGFASLGAPFLSSNIDPQYEVNELRNPVAYKGAVRPILAPLWDDLQLSEAANLTYKTEGIAPNRTFTAQWKNMLWQNGGSAAISFQLKLHETTNIVSFHYSPGAGILGAGAGASIGITTQKNTIFEAEVDGPYYLSLNGSSNVAAALDSLETDGINSKPTGGQEFRFTPVTCTPPTNIKLMNYNSNTATIAWLSNGSGSNYQMALSNIDVEPMVGTTVSTNSHTFGNLASNTDYFFFIKETCGTTWTRFKFKTCAIVALPYTQGFEASLDSDLPSDLTSQTSSNDFADMHWQSSNLLNASTGSKKGINSARFAKADSWLYTASFPLQVGGVYQLSFKYSRTAATDIGISGTPVLKLLVKYGLRAGSTGMVDTIVFLSTITNTSYATQTIQFSPASSGDYNIGFGFQSDVTDAIILLDDISLTVNSVPLPLRLLSFEAKLNVQEEVDLTWQTTAEQNVSHFELEHSIDGISFVNFGKTFANGSSLNDKTNYEYTHRKPANGYNYYRLKMVDQDGKFEFSPIRLVNLRQDLVTLLYPNPSGNEVFLKMPGVDQAKILVYNLEGKLLMTQIGNVNENESKITLTAQVPNGIYLVAVSTPNETRILKWLVE